MGEIDLSTMSVFNNETGSLLILGATTVALAVWFLVCLRWWLERKDVYYKMCNGHFALPFWLGSIVALVLVPMLILAHFMDDVSLVKDMTSQKRFLVFMIWLLPGLIYNLIYLIRKSRRN